MQYRELGKTGKKVSILGLGGEASVEDGNNPERAEEIINQALDGGVNYVDTAPVYGTGGSEQNIGRVMAYRREEVFLASKTHERSYDGTMRLIEKSLHRLQTDYLDLYQIHNLRLPEEVGEIFGNNGAVKALESLKSQGVINHIGVTGHKDPLVLRQVIENYDFDCVLLALNAADPHRQSFRDGVLDLAMEKKMGIIAMKVFAKGRLVENGGPTSYEEALGFVLTYPVSTVIIGTSTLEELEMNLSFCRDFLGFEEEKMRLIEEKTALMEKEGNFFKIEW